MRSGAAWELHLERWCVTYAMRGEAQIWRCHPGAKVVDGRLVYSSSGPPDFMGILASGRFVIFDAKEIRSTRRFPFKNLEAHQAAAFDAADSHGGLAFLAVQSWRGPDLPPERYIVAWSRVTGLYNKWRNKETTTAGIDLLVYGNKFEDGWLPTVLEML